MNTFQVLTTSNNHFFNLYQFLNFITDICFQTVDVNKNLMVKLYCFLLWNHWNLKMEFYNWRKVREDKNIKSGWNVIQKQEEC